MAGIVTLLPLLGSFQGDAPKLFRLIFLEQHFPALEFWWQYQLREILPCLPLSGYSCSVPQKCGFKPDHLSGLITVVQKT